MKYSQIISEIVGKHNSVSHFAPKGNGFKHCHFSTKNDRFQLDCPRMYGLHKKGPM